MWSWDAKLLLMDLLKTIVKKRDFLAVIFLSFFIFLSIRALMHPGFFRTIDDITTIRISYMEKELLRGNWLNNFPVRMSGELSNNFSYPLYLFYAPLTYYAGALLMWLSGLSHIVATKYVYAFPLLFGPFAFYFAARLKTSWFPALIASILFTLFPYRGTNTYLRGAAPEAWAIAFVPLAFAGLFLMQKNNNLGGYLFAASLSLVILSHNITGMLLVGFVVLYGVFFFLKNKAFWKFLALGIGLTAFYLIPMVYYLKIIRVTYLDINTTYIFQTLEPISALLKIQINELVWRVSGVFFFIISGSLIFFLYLKKKGDKNLGEIFFWELSGLVLYLFLFDPFILFWKITSPASGILQFVWRILSLLSFIIPLILAFVLQKIKNLHLKIVLAAITIIASLNFLPSFKPDNYSFFYEYKPEGQCATTSWQDEYLPIWVKGCPESRKPIQVIPETEINILKDESLLVVAEVKTDTDSELIVNKFYFPGWHIYIDGKNSPLDYNFSIDGTFKTPISSGNHRVEVVYKQTLVMWLANSISVFSLFLLIYFLFRQLNRHNQKSRTQKAPNH